MAYAHEHNHSIVLTNINKAFQVGILLNLGYVIIQIAVGIHIHSLSLLSDAGHNFADVASLALSLIAFKLHKVKPTERFTYGYRKISVIIALMNSVILLISIGIIGFEAIQHLFHPEPLPGKTIALIAFVGIFINGISALLFLKNKEKDLNIKSAFLHLAADALISAGLVVGGIIIYFTHLYWIDALLSLLIAFFILVSTWKLLRDSMKLTLDGVPDTVNVDAIKKAILSINGILTIHHLHVWAISTTENALTVHLVLGDNISIEQELVIKSSLRHELQHLNIHHITIETERESHHCDEKEC